MRTDDGQIRRSRPLGRTLWFSRPSCSIDPRLDSGSSWWDLLNGWGFPFSRLFPSLCAFRLIRLLRGVEKRVLIQQAADQPVGVAVTGVPEPADQSLANLLVTVPGLIVVAVSPQLSPTRHLVAL